MADGAGGARSPREELEQLRSDVAQEANGFDHLRYILRLLAEEANEWAGIPMPLDGQRLIIEPSYPSAKTLMQLGGTEDQMTPLVSVSRQRAAQGEVVHQADDFKPRNVFWSWRRRGEIHVWDENGKIEWCVVHRFNHFPMDLATLGCMDAWGFKQEARAIETLATLLPQHQFKQYMLTGMFIESSPRSQITYIFRRLKPTVALSKRTDELRILCALCLHPIGYYEGSWAGSMVPTDDVIAHLMLMRGDEHMFWRRANQHPPYRPEAGL